MAPTGTYRIHGLDTLRAIAVALVLIYHYEVVVSQKATFGFLTDLGWCGVDLFFVLSGYLIGNQILSGMARKEPVALSTFFARRLMRTLPNYYVVLAIYWLVPEFAGSSTAPVWRFLTFTQNFGLRYGQTFTHSWSLCIEEQFYLALPVVALLLGRTRSIKWAWVALWAAMAACVVFRGLAWKGGLNAFSAELYYSTFARSDELLPGVAIALLKNFHADTYGALLRRGNSLLALGFVLVAISLLGLSEANSEQFISTTFGFSLLSIGFAALVLSALSPDSLLNRIHVPGAASLALWSYAVYLAHKPIFVLMAKALHARNVDTDQPWAVALIVAAGVFGGWLLYLLVEAPFMSLRSRWFPARSAAPMPEAIKLAA